MSQPRSTLRSRETHLRFKGSLSLSFWRTRTSILLASRYFGIARMILMATLLLVWVSTASTTLPNVPWPKSRTVRSESNGRQHEARRGKAASGLTSTRNHVVRNDDVVALLVIARRVVVGRLRWKGIRAGEKRLDDDVDTRWPHTSFVTAPLVEAHCFEVAEVGTPFVMGFLTERGVSSATSLLRFLGGGGRIAVDVLADKLPCASAAALALVRTGAE